MTNDMIQKLVDFTRQTAETYANRYHDADSLFSEGLSTLTTTLQNPNLDKIPYVDTQIRRNIKRQIIIKSQKIDDYIDYTYNINDYGVIDTYSIEPNVIREAIKKLKPIEQEVIWKYYGFEDEPRTLKEIGKDYNLSRSRIQQIQIKAKNKVKRYLIEERNSEL